LSQSPRLILANKPTRGLDIGAATYINQKLLDERAKGNGILLISADLDELLLLSDRILVMYNGQSMGELSAGRADIQKIGLMMAGTPLVEIEKQEAVA
jgi:simple sugar transport system ATP-binding protein